jgi:hypothetical protein
MGVTGGVSAALPIGAGAMGMHLCFFREARSQELPMRLCPRLCENYGCSQGGKMFHPRVMIDLANSAVKREIPWLVAVAVLAVALIALSEGYFA